MVIISSCSLDHSLIKGKFCPSCGAKKTELKKTCTQGHELTNEAKFCPICGSESRIGPDYCANNHEIKAGAKFCNVCGAAIKKPESPNLKSISNRDRDNDPKVQITWKNSISNAAQVSPVLSQEFNNSNFFPQDQTFVPKQKSNRNFIFAGIAGLAALLFVIVALGSISSESEPVTVSVEMVLIDEYDCFDVSWGYSDIPGGQVVLDVDGTKYFGSYTAFGQSSGSGCKFTASISGVKSDGVNYSIGMASGRRGTIYNTKSELEANGWTFYLSLG